MLKLEYPEGSSDIVKFETSCIFPYCIGKWNQSQDGQQILSAINRTTVLIPLQHPGMFWNAHKTITDTTIS